MGLFEITPERERLGFKQAVLSAFDFLVTEYGFECIRADALVVEYVSPNAAVSIVHEYVDFGIDVMIYLRTDQSERYLGRGESLGLGDILDLVDARRKEHYQYFTARKPEKVREYVQRVAELTRGYADRALRGDPKIYEEIDEAAAKGLIWSRPRFQRQHCARSVRVGRIEH